MSNRNWDEEHRLHVGLLERLCDLFNCSGSIIVDPLAQTAFTELHNYFFAHPWVSRQDEKTERLNVIPFKRPL